jgi:PEP-CTERM/exosortase A-associated glycosyltransferase
VVYEARAFWEDAAVDHGTTREGSPRYRLTRALETALFRRATAVVTIAQAMRREVMARGVPEERITVAGNGVDADWFHPIERPARLADRLGLDGGPVVGFVGSFYRYEGLGFLLRCLPALRERVPGLRVLLVGGGEEEAALRRDAAPLDGGVVFAGQVPYAQVRAFYALTDVFVCPRRRMRLTELVTPLKPLEAMAMARPVLASDVGGLAELIRHGETGLLFPADSPEAFVEQAAALARRPDFRERLGQRAREAVLAERTWPAVVRRYADLYAAVTRPAAGQPGRAAAPAGPAPGAGGRTGAG